MRKLLLFFLFLLVLTGCGSNPVLPDSDMVYVHIVPYWDVTAYPKIHGSSITTFFVMAKTKDGTIISVDPHDFVFHGGADENGVFLVDETTPAGTYFMWAEYNGFSSPWVKFTVSYQDHF